MRAAFWKYLYFAAAYAPNGKPYVWTIGPHPAALNRLTNYLHAKWMAS